MEILLLLGVFAIGTFLFTDSDDDSTDSASGGGDDDDTTDGTTGGGEDDGSDITDGFTILDTVTGAELDVPGFPEIDNVIEGSASAEEINGTSGNDAIDGGNGADTIVGSGGADVVLAGGGADVVTGNSGTDFIDGENGADTIEGNGGNDVIFGGTGDDELDGQDGDDLLFGEAGDDNVHGGEGNDIIVGDEGEDTLRGGAGDDYIIGHQPTGDLAVVGEADAIDADTIRGGAGNDFILLGSGDYANGGEGFDEFRTGTHVDGDNLPVVTGYVPNDDVVSVVVPEGAAGVITIEEGSTPNDAVILVDGQEVVIIENTFEYMEPADVNVVFEFTPLEAVEATA